MSNSAQASSRKAKRSGGASPKRARGRTARAQEERAARPAHPWMTVEDAAAFLCMPTITLRRNIKRSAQRSDNGAMMANLDGITARKFGRFWRVWLDASWLSPSPRGVSRKKT